MNRGCSGDGGLTPRPIPPGGKIELAPFPPLIVVEGGSILVPKVKEVAPNIPAGVAEPGGESPPVRPPRGLGGPIPRPIPVVPRPPLIVVAV